MSKRKKIGIIVTASVLVVALVSGLLVFFMNRNKENAESTGKLHTINAYIVHSAGDKLTLASVDREQLVPLGIIKLSATGATLLGAGANSVSSMDFKTVTYVQVQFYGVGSTSYGLTTIENVKSIQALTEFYRDEIAIASAMYRTYTGKKEQNAVPADNEITAYDAYVIEVQDGRIACSDSSKSSEISVYYSITNHTYFLDEAGNAVDSIDFEKHKFVRVTTGALKESLPAQGDAYWIRILNEPSGAE